MILNGFLLFCFTTSLLAPPARPSPGSSKAALEPQEIGDDHAGLRCGHARQGVPEI